MSPSCTVSRRGEIRPVTTPYSVLHFAEPRADTGRDHRTTDILSATRSCAIARYPVCGGGNAGGTVKAACSSLTDSTSNTLAWYYCRYSRYCCAVCMVLYFLTMGD